MRILFLFLLSVFLQVTAYSQSSERPEGIVLPVATLGDVTETRRQILQNTIIESLSSYYRLVPQDKLEEVQEKIFQEMDYDECTEDQCIVMIQEALQVENLFVLQVIGEGDDTQLSLKWVGLDDKKVKTDVCKGCGTFELNERVKGLVRNLESVIPRGSVLISKKEEDIVLTNNKDLKKNNFIKEDKDYTSVFSLGLISDYSIPRYTKIDGFRLNFFGGYQESVDGFDFGIINQAGKFDGAQLAFLGNYTKIQVTGYQISTWLNLNKGEADGIHISAFSNVNQGESKGSHQYSTSFNYSETIKIQLGGINYSSDYAYTQIGIANYSKNSSIQLFGFNYSENNDGSQFGFVNYAKNVEGLQFGMINIAENLKGYQIGLINIHSNAEIFKVFPIVNISF